MPGILARRPGRTLGGMAFDPRLGERFMFGEADLVANRDGRVSDEQARGFDATVEVMTRREPRVLIVLAVVFAVVIGVVVVAVANTPGGGLSGGVVAGVILAWIFAIILFFLHRGRRLTRAFAERRVLRAEGPLSIRTTSTGTWFAHVGQARFAVELLQAQALEEDAGYRVHYLDAPDGGIPLSLERT